MGTDSADPSSSSGRRPAPCPDLEEGEIDDDSAGPDGDIRDVVQNLHGNDARPERSLERAVVDGGVLPLPSRERDSEGTVNDINIHADAGAASLAQEPCFFPCPVCREKFRSELAMHGHMSVHDLEEGEMVASDLDHGNDARPERLLEGAVVDGGALPLPSCERDSDGTVSDIDIDADSGAASLAQEPCFFTCPVCLEKFRNELAMHGHMSVHDPHGRQLGERAPAMGGGWAVTARRSSVRRRSVPPESQEVVDSMAILVSEPVIDTKPFTFASSSSSAESNPTNQVVVHPPCSPQFLQGHKPAASQVLVAQAQQPAEAAAPQFVVHQPAAPPVVARNVQRASPPPPVRDRDEQGWWHCKEKGCDQRFATHRGLGGHMASHKIRQNNEAGDAGLHACKHCPKVFTSGYQLGGHMGMHRGKATPKKGGARREVSARELASAPALSLPMPPAAMEVAPAQPAVAPGVPGVLRLFGVNIIVPASAAEDASSTMTETDQSSAASTNTEQ